MKNLIIPILALSLSVISCNKEDKKDNNSRDTVSLLMSTQYAANPNYTFEYDEEHRLTKAVINGGTEVKEYQYNANGDFMSFTETSQSNALYPTRRFEVEVSTPNEISGSFYLMDPSGVVDSTATSQIRYELDGGLIKKYSQIPQNGNVWEKSFEHNAAGDLTAIQLFENPNQGHLYRIEFTQWDNKTETNIFASFLQTYPAMDIIPGIKLSNHNMIDKQDLYQGIDCCGTSSYEYEYNDYDQIKRIYTFTSDQIDEDGNIIVTGGEEVDIAIFNYEIFD